MLKSQLHDQLATAGAKWMDYHGWEIPANFGDSQAEHKTVRENIGLLDFSHLTKILASGADAKDYFHRRLTNHIMKLHPGDGSQTCLLKGNGRLIAELTVHSNEDGLVMLSSPLLRESLFEEFDKYIFDEECKLLDATEQFAVLTIFGTQTETFFDQALGKGQYPKEFWHHAEVECCEVPMTLIRADLIAAPCFHLLIEAQLAKEAFPVILQHIKEANGSLVGFEAFQSLRIEAGKPIFGNELSEKILPLEARLQPTLDRDKGCYPGQEVMARIMNLAHPSKWLVGFHVENAAPQIDEKISINGNEIGHITSSAYSPTLEKNIALGYVRWENRESGTQVTIGENKATIVDLPML